MPADERDDLHDPSEDQLFSELREAVLEDRREHGTSASDARLPELEGYDVLQEIHRGSQGVVYRALQRSTRRVVAVKVLIDGRHSGTEERARFEREITVAASLDHASIVTVYEAGVTGGRLWYAMQLVDGERLDDFLDRAGSDGRLRVSLLRDVARVVDHAHQRGVVHRDLKPSNVVVDDGGAPHVLDFGLAKPLLGREDMTDLTSTGNFLGTLAYASPEQVGPAAHRVDVRVDVHALGVMLFEAMTGRRPFEGQGGVSSMVQAVATEPPPDPARLVPAIDRDLRAILLMALAKSPDDRYRDAGELADDLSRWLDNEPVAARRPRPWRHFVALVRRRRGLAALLAVLVLGTLGAALAVDHVADVGDRYRQAYERELTGELGMMGRPTGVLQSFLRAARSVDESLPDDAVARANVHIAVGTAFAVRFELGAAEYFHGTARALLEGMEAPDDGALADAWERLGTTQLRADDPEAVSSLREAHRLGGAHAGVSALLAHALARRGSEADLTEAAELLATLDSTDGGQAAQDALRTHHAEGALAVAEGDVDRAQAAFERALAAASAGGLLDDVGADSARDAPPDADALRSPPSPPFDAVAEVTDLHLDLAHLAMERGDAAGSWAHVDGIVALSHRRYGPEALPELLWAVSIVQAARARPGLALRLQARAMPLMLRSWAPASVEHGPSLQTLAARFDATGEDLWSLPWTESFEHLKRVRGLGTYELADGANDVAALAHDAERPGVAEALLEESLTIRCSALGMDCPHRVESLLQLGRVRVGTGALSQAHAPLQEAAETLVRIGALGRSGAATRALEVGELLARLGDLDPARELAGGLDAAGTLDGDAELRARLSVLLESTGHELH
jgi:hypothetical protein